MKTCVPGKIPREAAIWCKAAVTLPETIPLLSCMCGNAMPGAPVTVPMSGFAVQSNQGGTVEYFVSHP